MDKELKIFDGTTLPERQEQPAQNMMQIRSQFVAAMHVPIPRDDEKILANINKIAEKRGHAFFYMWPVKDHNTKKVSIISGGTIDLAETFLYYWTNTAVEDEIQDLGDKWKIKHIFIDFERGIQRSKTAFIQKPQKAPGGWDKERWERMCFSKAASYNIRDLVFRVIPRWMKDEIIERAKIAEIKRSKEEFNSQEAIDLFAAIKIDYGIDKADLMSFYGISEIGYEDYFKIKNLYAQIVRKDITLESVLKNIDKPKKQQENKPLVDSSKKEPTTEAKPDEEKSGISEISAYLKSLEMRDITETEICAYFMIDQLDQLNEQQRDELKSIVTDIEAEKITPEEFKKSAVERFDLMRDK